MAIFNSAFQKNMLANGQTVQNTTTDWLVSAANLNLQQIANLGPGYIAILDPNSYTSVNPSTYQGNFIIANTSLFSNDKYGMHGGYKMCDLSKIINRNFVSRLAYTSKHDPVNAVYLIGGNQSNQQGLDCTPNIYCDQTYILRIDIKGSAALRTHVRNVYRYLTVKTPCCVGGQVAMIDPTWLFIQLAEQIVKDPYLNQYIVPVVTSNGADGSTIENYIAPAQYGVVYPSNVTATNTWDTYQLGNNVQPQNVVAGLYLVTAYVDTHFGTCSFMPSDYEEYAPLSVSASFVDSEGNPCDSLQYCAVLLEAGFVGRGHGLSIQKEILETQAYLQNYLSDDVRIREAAGTGDLLINTGVRYNKFVLIHDIPRHMGLSSNGSMNVFNSDRYVITINTPLDPATGNGTALFTTFLNNNFGASSILQDTQTYNPYTIS